MSFLRRACGIVWSRALAAASVGATVLGMAAVFVAMSGFAASPAQAGAKRKPAVLIVYAPTTPGSTDVQAKLMSSGEFAKVDRFETTDPPSYELLVTYDAVLLYNTTARFSPFGDMRLGENLGAYVDAGGGVVSMGCAETEAYGPEGRLLEDHGVLAFNSANLVPTGTLNVASISNANHPILIGVNTLSLGAANLRSDATSAHGTILVKYADNTVLAGVDNSTSRYVDLNFFPVSSDGIVGGWDKNTDGLKLMVNSLLYVMRPRVLLLSSDPYSWILYGQLTGNLIPPPPPVLGVIDEWIAGASTPTLNDLLKYDAVLVWSSDNFFNATALGNVLADYVDAGGGVVSASHITSTNPDDGRRLQGRWRSGGYEIIVGASGTNSPSEEVLGSVPIPNHPIMAGVSTFDGGTASYRPNTKLLNPSGLKVALWSDGSTLVAVSSKFPTRVDLGFYPVANDGSLPDSWNSTSDGFLILTSALVYAAKPYVGCLSADTLNANDPKVKLIASRRFSGVLGIDAAGSTPALATLSPLSAVMMWTNESVNNRAALGNVLADYMDAGGGSVTTVFGNTVSPPPVAGRWVTDGYEIVPSPLPIGLQGGSPILGTILEPGHPIARFVRKFGGGVNWRVPGTPLLRGRTIMKWSDGTMLASVHTFRKRADLGMYPPSTGAYVNGWNQRTDGTWLMANALEWASRSKPCPGDFNGDGLVDDSDFILFVGYYNTLVDPRGDLTGDGLTEDGDFSKFVGGYNDLVCP